MPSVAFESKYKRIRGVGIANFDTPGSVGEKIFYPVKRPAVSYVEISFVTVKRRILHFVWISGIIVSYMVD